MCEDIRHAELHEQTQQLLQGPLKHVRAAALAAALLPLASVAATPAAAQSTCTPSSGGLATCVVSGFVWNDLNNNGVQDAGEPGLEGAKVSVYDDTQTLLAETETDSDGNYSFFDITEGTITIVVKIPQGMQASAANVGADDVDSDGVPDGGGFSLATTTLASGENPDTDFGFSTLAVQQPGTGTPGYWKNHPEAWPVTSITVGGVNYTVTEAIAWLGKVGKDKTTTMFSSLVPAMLNVLIGNDGSCVSSAIAAANNWMATYGPVGSKVAASSGAWSIGEPLHRQMDAYNNGLLCAPHRD